VEHDLIVVGGGPVGASLARAARGLSVAVLAHERPVVVTKAPGSFDARVYALSPANAAFLELGETALTPVYSMRIYGDREAQIEFDAYRAGVPALAYIVEHGDVQKALWDGLDATIAGWQAIDVQDNLARVRLDDGRELAGKLIVGADGAHSRVREQAGISASDRAYGQSAVVANFACERAHANTAYQWFQGGPVLALLPLPGSHVSMVWSLPIEQAHRIEQLEAGELCREVELATGSAVGGLRLVTPPRSYPLRRLRARRLIAPRVALVGDAAHVIHPLAGQGLNLGLQDARALSQVLAERESVRDAGDWRLLRRYERQRAEPILAMDAMVEGLYRLFGAQGEVAQRVRNSGLNLTNRLAVVKNLLIRQAMS
jgi:2-polyprenylphenol 6-hydroxylase